VTLTLLSGTSFITWSRSLTFCRKFPNWNLRRLHQGIIQRLPRSMLILTLCMELLLLILFWWTKNQSSRPQSMQGQSLLMILRPSLLIQLTFSAEKWYQPLSHPLIFCYQLIAYDRIKKQLCQSFQLFQLNYVILNDRTYALICCHTCNPGFPSGRAHVSLTVHFLYYIHTKGPISLQKLKHGFIVNIKMFAFWSL